MKKARLLVCSSLTVLPCLASAQSDRKIGADMDFARELASRFAYVDMAEEVISSLEARNLTGENAEGLGLLKCDVYAAGAKSEPSAAQRLVLYDKAIEAFEEYMGDNPHSELLPQAQRNYISLVNNYGRVLEIELEDQVGADADAIRERIKTVITAGLELTGDQISLLSGSLTQVQKLEKFRLMLNRGQMLLTLASVSEDGTWYFAQAEQVLENLALEAGETSGPGLNSFLLLARVKMAQGDFQSCVDFSQYVVDVVMPTDPAVQNEQGRWNDLSFEEKVPRWKLAELGTAPLVDAYMAMGDPTDVEQGCFWALHYYNTWRVEGFDISPIGYLSLLSCARALLDSGGAVGGGINQGNLKWFTDEDAMKAGGFAGRNARTALELALQIAQSVNEENRGNTLQQRAQKVISDITNRPGVQVSPDILFEAAQGEYYAENYARAIESFKGIMAQLETRDQATQQEYAPKVLWHVGSSLSKMERKLEAAMAFREAATRWAGDPEYQEKVAKGYYSSMQEAKRGTGGDPLLEQLYLEAEGLLASASTGGPKGTIQFRRGERAYSQEDYTTARQEYLAIEQGEDDYEKGRVKAALMLYKMKDYDGAAKEFADYVDNYVTNPTNKLTANSKIQKRQEATAQATYYLGLIANKKQEFPTVVERLDLYHERFPNQTSYGPNALYLVVLARIASGEVEQAKAVNAQMKDAFGTHPRTGTAAIQIYQAIKQRKEEAEKDGDAQAALALKAEMAEYMHLSNELSGDPAFDNLRQESTLWLELGRWTEANAVLDLIVAKYGEDPEEKQKVEVHVLPDLGLALLEQKRVPEAFAILDPLIPKEDADERKPKSATVRRWCRSVTGWVEGDSDNLVEVPGQGGADNLKGACDWLLNLTELEKASGAGDWTCPWYELKFEMAYGYYQWGKEDSTKTEIANGIIKNLQDWLGETDLKSVADSCGDDVLQRRYRWLWGKVQ